MLMHMLMHMHIRFMCMSMCMCMCRLGLFWVIYGLCERSSLSRLNGVCLPALACTMFEAVSGHKPT